MYQLLATVYELHGGYYCSAELVHREHEHLEHVISVSFHWPLLDRPDIQELDAILGCFGQVCPKIAGKLDVPLF